MLQLKLVRIEQTTLSNYFENIMNKSSYTRPDYLTLNYIEETL